MTNLHNLIAVGAVCALSAAAFYSGWHWRAQKCTGQIAAIQAAAADAQLAAEKDYSARLAEALAAQKRLAEENTLISQEFARAQQQIADNARVLQKRIDDAVQKDTADSACFNGLGTHSLRLYAEALGY